MEKRRNLLILLLMLAGCSVPFLLASCDLNKTEEENKNTGTIELPSGEILCACPEKDHLDVGGKCKCGGEDCDCTLKTYGVLQELRRGDPEKGEYPHILYKTGGYQIPIYKLGNFARGHNMEDAVAGLQFTYDRVKYSPDIAENLIGMITEIHVYDPTVHVPPAYAQYDGRCFYVKDGDKLIFGLIYDWACNDRLIIGDLAEGSIPLTVATSGKNNNIRMTKSTSGPGPEPKDRLSGAGRKLQAGAVHISGLAKRIGSRFANAKGFIANLKRNSFRGYVYNG